MKKLSFDKLNIAQIFALLLLVSLFFPVRYVFPTQIAFQTGAYSDFTSISLYISDIFLFFTVIFTFLPRGEGFYHVVKSTRILVLWLILSIFWHFSAKSTLNAWFFFKLMELVVAYGTFSYLFSKTDIKQLFVKVFVIFSSLESLLAVFQFLSQRSLGLGKIGEQILSPQIQGVAKIVSGGTTFIRGYGTFPHPNLLSAFLVAGLCFCVYLLVTETSFKTKALYSLIFFLNAVGLCLTFSRAGYLATATALTIILGYLFFCVNKEAKKNILKIATVVCVSGLICLAMFQPYIFSRATVTDQATLERVFYAKLGAQIVKNNPVFGIGIGESVLHMQQYSTVKLWPWQIQPVHNYFLLAAAEIGIVGGLILFWIFIAHLIKLYKKIKSEENFQIRVYQVTLLAILISFLVLMQFDHYFYTLQQTQFLLWIFLGIVSSETKNPSGPEGLS